MVMVPQRGCSVFRSSGLWLAAACSAAVVALAAAAPAGAEPVSTPALGPASAAATGHRMAVDTPVHMYATPATPAAKVSQTIYLERCKGGCSIHAGNNDARTNTSSIPKMESVIKEFATAGTAGTPGMTGAAADTEWAQVVQCMKEVYSPYAVTITDVKPASGSSYHEAIIAGQPQDIGLDNNILGVAPLASDCSAIDNVISFSFANRHDANDRVNNICWTAAQESAHAFGLDHEWSFPATPTERSACNDPMTYRTDCGGQKFFRNESANCGETEKRACKCSALQNSHQKILGVFGAGTSITGSPTITMTTPVAGGTLGKGLTFQAGSKRGVSRVELYFNGYMWAAVPGAAFGDQGQLDPAGYSALVPTELPDSIVDVKAIAYEDIGTSTSSEVVTVTKGAACATAATCATGQRCEAGKCFWDPPSGELGDSCAYKQFCKSGLCTGTASEQICTQSCVLGSTDSCPSGLDCVMETATTGVCFFQDTGGCCSVDHGGSGWWVHAAISALVLGFMVRRRRR